MATANYFTQLGRSAILGVRASAGPSYHEATTAHDLRKVLGVGLNASKGDVKAAYRRLALQLHPDVCQGETTRDVRFWEVNRAYESLMQTAPIVEALSFYNEHSSKYEYYPPRASEDDDDDPWADFLHSLVKGSYEHQLSTARASDNTRNSTRALTSSSS